MTNAHGERPRRANTRLSKIESALEERFRYRRVEERIEIDFPKASTDAKQEVISALDAITPAWRRVFVIYPQ